MKKNKKTKKEYIARFYARYENYTEWDSDGIIIASKFCVVNNYSNNKYQNYKIRQSFKRFVRRVQKIYGLYYNNYKILFGIENVSN